MIKSRYFSFLFSVSSFSAFFSLSCISLSIAPQLVSNWQRWCGERSVSAVSGVADRHWQRVIWEYEHNSLKRQVDTTSHESHSVAWYSKGLWRQTLEWVLKVWKQSIPHPPVSTALSSTMLQKGQMKLTCHGQTHHLTVAGLLSFSLS